jgi:DNA-binding IclR family transcriptional regulator
MIRTKDELRIDAMARGMESPSGATVAGEEGYRVPAVERTFTILRVLATSGQSSLADIVNGSGLNKSTTFYILRTLVMLDVVACDERTRQYTLGPALMELGLSASGQFNDVDIAKRSLAELLETMNITIVLYRRVNVGEIIMVDKIERAHRVRITVQAGSHLPIQGASFGRVFLAYDDAVTVDEALKDGLHKFTPKSLTRVPVFRRELAEVRERGWAVDHEGFALGVSTVAAPIFGPDGKVVLVAAAVGFTNLFTDEVTGQCGVELRRSCDRVSRLLGGEPPAPIAVRSRAGSRAR